VGRPGRIATGVLAAAVVLVAGSPADADPERGLGFELRKTSVGPKHPYIDGKRKVTLHYGFAARRPLTVEIRVLRAKSGDTVRVWRERRLAPGERYLREWNGLNRRERPVPDGRYVFRVGPAAGKLERAGKTRIHGNTYPIEGSHSPRGEIGEFGAPRSGGRTHEGYDELADCGTPLVAARGGTVNKAGYDDELYGYFVLIDGYKTNRDYFYAHLIAPARVDDGERVHTGTAIGRVGKTGNARTTPCHLHFELHVHGRPIDPEPALRRWDRWS
jgi:murein DD-endopeptidase MepM/ murein hydrolase activator NlpD